MIVLRISGQVVVVPCAQLLQSCPTLCDPVDHGLPGSTVHGILQVRIQERVIVDCASAGVCVILFSLFNQVMCVGEKDH